MGLKLSNNADGLLALAISDSDTSLTLEAGHGSRFPALGSGDWFPITVVRASDPSKFEIMRCTARTLDTLTVERAQEGTAAITFSAGDVVELRLTAGTLEENFPQVEGANAKNLRFSIDSVGGKPELKFKSGDDEETVVRQSDLSNLDPDTQVMWDTPAGDRLGVRTLNSAVRSIIYFGSSEEPNRTEVRVYGPSDASFPSSVMLVSDNTIQAVIDPDGVGVGGASTPRLGAGTLNAENGLYDGGERVYSPNNNPTNMSGLRQINFDFPTGGQGAVRSLWSSGREIMYLLAGEDAQNDIRIYGGGDSTLPNQCRIRLNGNEVVVMRPDRVDFNSPIYINGKEVAGSLGVGQTWQDVTAQRATGVNYTNTTGRTIFVAAGDDANDSSSNLELVVDGEKISSFRVGGGSQLTKCITVSGLVPPGSIYRINRLSGGDNFSWWKELR